MVLAFSPVCHNIVLSFEADYFSLFGLVTVLEKRGQCSMCRTKLVAGWFRNSC